MCLPVKVDQSPSWIMASTTSAGPLPAPHLMVGSRYGALVIDSIPPATTVSTSPARII